MLTQRGRDFWPVLVLLTEWGNRHFAEEGIASRLVDAVTGEPADPVLVDRCSGKPIDETGFRFAAGPAAGERILKRMDFVDRQRRKVDS